MEMTPLIDVVFLLLIFFVVTTSFTRMQEQKDKESPKEEEIPLNLPEATTGQAPTEGQKVTIFVRSDGTIELRGDVDVQGETFREKLADLQEKQPDARIMLKGDREATHGRMIELFDEIRQSGFKRVNLVTRSGD